MTSLEKSTKHKKNHSTQFLPENRVLSIYFYEARITLITKPDKDSIKKENYRPISFINKDTKTLNKKLAKRIQQHIKRLLHHECKGFIPRIQCWCNI